MDSLLSVDSVLGDSWVARLREDHAKHAYLTHGKETAMTATAHTPDNPGWVTFLVERWAVATAGGRAITSQLYEKRTRAGGAMLVNEMAADPGRTWHFQLDPSGSYQHGDERREPEARAAWQRIAEEDANPHRVGAFGLPLDALSQSAAESMFDWPIYRAAMVAEVYGALWAQASDGEEEVLDQLAHCAGIETGALRPVSKYG